MRLYIYNVILVDTILPLTTRDYMTTTQKNTRKKTSATEGIEPELTAKRMQQTYGKDTEDEIPGTGALKMSVAKCTKIKAQMGINKKR